MVVREATRRGAAGGALTAIVAFLLAPVMVFLTPASAAASVSVDDVVKVEPDTSSKPGTKLAPLRTILKRLPVGRVISAGSVIASLAEGSTIQQQLSLDPREWIFGETDRPEGWQGIGAEPSYCRGVFSFGPEFEPGSPRLVSYGLRIQQVTPPEVHECGPNDNLSNMYVHCEGVTPAGSSEPIAVQRVPISRASGDYHSLNPCAQVAIQAAWQNYQIIGLEVGTNTGNGFAMASGARGWYPNPYVELMPEALDHQVGSVRLRTERKCETAAGEIVTVEWIGPVGGDVLTFAECPAGSMPVESTVFSESPYGDASTVIEQNSIPAEMRDEYKQCLSAAVGAVGCGMSVYVDGLECTYTRPDCKAWWPIANQNPQRVWCMWGPYSIPVTDCEPLRWAYETQHGAVANPEVAPEKMPTPNTGTGTVTTPGQLPYEDPKTWPTQRPTPGPSAPPTSRPVDPTPDPSPTINPVPPPRDVVVPGGQNCIAQMFTWNPVDWVFVPVRCALEWAFVPRQQVATQVSTQLQTSVQGTAVTKWRDTLKPYEEAFEVEGSGCMGPPMTLGHPFNDTFYPAYACDGPAKTLADVSKIGLSAVLIVAGGWACVRLVMAGIGYNTGGGAG